MLARGLIVFALVAAVTNAQILDFCDQNDILDLINGVTNGLLGINILPAQGILEAVGQTLLGTAVAAPNKCLARLGAPQGPLNLLSGLTGKLALGCISQDAEKAVQLCNLDVLQKVIDDNGCVKGGLSVLQGTGGGLITGVLGGGLIGTLFGTTSRLPLVGKLLGGGLLANVGALLDDKGCLVDISNLAKVRCLLEAGKQNCRKIVSFASEQNCDVCKLLSIVADAPKIADCTCTKIPNFGLGGDLVNLLEGVHPVCLVDQGVVVIEGLLQRLLGIVLQLLGGVAQIPILNQCVAAL